MHLLTSTEVFEIAFRDKTENENWSKWYTVSGSYLVQLKTGATFLSDELLEWLDDHNADNQSIRMVNSWGIKLQFKDDNTLIMYLLTFGK